MLSPMLDVKVSAPGKIILSGEHAVVYAGRPAIAASINRRTAARLRTVPGRSVTVELTSLGSRHVVSLDQLMSWEVLSTTGISLPEDGAPALLNALRIVLFLLRSMLSTMQAQLTTGLVLTITSDLVLGAGSGSSAAFAVSVAGSVYTLARWCRFQADPTRKSVTLDLEAGLEGLPPEAQDSLRGLRGLRVDVAQWNTFDNTDKEVINFWAYQAEKVTHGKPSGLDNTICTYGGLVRLTRQQEGDNQIDRIQHIFPLEILLIDTRVPRRTADLVARVAALKQADEERFGRLLTAMGEVTNQFSETLEVLAARGRSGGGDGSGEGNGTAEEFRKLEDLVRQNQDLLAQLGVSHPRLDAIVATCRQYGLAAKLTGAGGGGYAYAVVPPARDRADVSRCVVELQRAGYVVTADLQLGGPGVELIVADGKERS